MKQKTSERTPILLTLALAILLAAAPAFANNLAAARDAGQVGERLDGYVGIVVANPSTELRALVEDINARRKAKYARIAERNSTPVAQVAALAAEKLIRMAAPGHFVQGKDRRWVRSGSGS